MQDPLLMYMTGMARRLSNTEEVVLDQLLGEAGNIEIEFSRSDTEVKVVA